MTPFNDLFSNSSRGNSLDYSCFTTKGATVEQAKKLTKTLRSVLRYDKSLSIFNSKQMEFIIASGFFMNNVDIIKHRYNDFYNENKQLFISKK